MRGFTPSQKKAMETDKGNIMVSAPAGSGKTFVMIQRLIRLVIEGKTSVDRVLCVTFTHLAAAEMKEKLTSALIEKINDGNAALKKQLEMVPSASICTFHSFCNTLIKNYFYAVGLDSDYRILEDYERKQMQERAINAVFAEKYEKHDPDFLKTVEMLYKYRSDKNLKKVIINVFEKSRCYTDEEILFDDTLNNYSKNAFSSLCAEMLGCYREMLGCIKNELEDCRDYFSNVYPKQSEFLESVIAEINVLLSSENLTKFCAYLLTIPSFKRPQFPKGDEENKAYMVNTYERFKSVLKGINKILPFDEDEERSKLTMAGEAAFGVISLVKEFTKTYDEMKRDEGVLDFSDLEKFAYKLCQMSEISDEIKSKYDFIFADEYQDTNEVQEAILNCISENNTFKVGDVKQSIYEFRGCNPSLFLNGVNRTKESGEAYELEENFRSSDGVLSGVNSVFEYLLTLRTGGVDYRAHKMQRGGLYPEGIGYTRLHVVGEQNGDEESEESDDDTDECYAVSTESDRIKGVYSVKKHLEVLTEKREHSAASKAIFGIIADVLNEKIYDVKSGEYRETEFGDIAILVRGGGNGSNGSKTVKLLDDLADMGIPCKAETKKSVLFYPEIKFLINLLELIDFFEQDIPLIAVLKSPIGGICENELASIKLHADRLAAERGEKISNRPFYYAVKEYAETETDKIAEKILSFMKYYEKLRCLSEFMCASDLLLKVIAEFDLDLYYRTMTFGEQRVKRINFFVMQGAEKKLSVSDFLKKIYSAGGELAMSFSEGNDSVTLMTMHASKGLEFPIVILADLSTKFNMREITEDVFFEKKHGFCFKTFDVESMTKSENILRYVGALEVKETKIKEEIRILYVAMTRAQYGLNLIVEEKSLPLFKPEELQILSANCFSDFLYRDGIQTVDFNGTNENVPLFGKRGAYVGKTDANLTEKLKKNFSFVYPDSEACNLLIKTSVSRAIKGEDGEYVPPVVFPDSEIDISPEKGTAIHRFLELVDFNKYDITSLKAQKDELLQSGKITDEQYSLISEDILVKVLNNDLFRLPNAKYYREKAFFVNVPYKLLGEFSSEESALVQGIIDLVIVDGDECIIVDYKLSGKSAARLKETYSKQLWLYRYALEHTTDYKVKQTFLVNLLSAEVLECI